MLDEPTSQLDPKGSEEVFKAVEALKAQGKTIIMVEHAIEKIAQYSDRVMLFHAGNLIAFDSPRKIFSRDDLSQYGVEAPVYTQICKQLSLCESDGLYPVTFERAYQLLQRNQKGNTQ